MEKISVITQLATVINSVSYLQLEKSQLQLTTRFARKKSFTTVKISVVTRLATRKNSAMTPIATRKKILAEIRFATRKILVATRVKQGKYIQPNLHESPHKIRQLLDESPSHFSSYTCVRVTIVSTTFPQTTNDNPLLKKKNPARNFGTHIQRRLNRLRFN